MENEVDSNECKCCKCCNCLDKCQNKDKSDNYNWNHILFVVDMLIQQGKLTELQIRKIINIVDIKKLVKYNKLRPEFIENVLRPLIECDFNSDSSDDLTLTDIYEIQQYNFGNKK
jgi:hypothetical protein